MSHKELDKLLKLCHKHGVKTLKIGDLELQIELDHPGLYPKPREAVIEPSSPVKGDSEPFSEEDALYWSVSQPMP